MNLNLDVFHYFWIITFFPHKGGRYDKAKNIWKETEVLLQIRMLYLQVCMPTKYMSKTHSQWLPVLPPLKRNTQLMSLNIILCYQKNATSLCLQNITGSPLCKHSLQILPHLIWLYCIHLFFKGQNKIYGLHKIFLDTLTAMKTLFKLTGISRYK